MAKLQDRVPWQTELKEILVGNHGMTVQSEESTDAQTTLRLSRNEQRYEITIVPLE